MIPQWLGSHKCLAFSEDKMGESTSGLFLSLKSEGELAFPQLGDHSWKPLFIKRGIEFLKFSPKGRGWGGGAGWFRIFP